MTDAVKQLKLDPDRDPRRLRRASRPVGRSTGRTTSCSPGTAPPAGSACPTATGSPDDREGLSFADATSAVFAYDIAVGQGRCRHLQLAKGARRRRRARRPDPRPARGRAAGKLHARPAAAQAVPADQSGKLNEGIFKGETINTPSMLAVEDAIFALEWAKAIGGARRPDRALATPMPRRSTGSSRSATGSAISRRTRRPDRRPASA